MGTIDPSQATTPSFSGAPIPGIGGGVGAQTQPPVDDRAKQILATLLQAAQRKQMANTAVPRPMEGMEDPREAQNIGMNTAWPRAWGTQRFLGGLAANIKNAVAKQKNDQLLKAEGDWTYLQSAMNDKFQAEQSGDQAGVQAAEAKLQVIMGDPKKLKNMAKALNQDWLNPEKTTVYGEALKRVAANQKQQDQQNDQKQSAAQKLKDAFMGLLKKKQDLQMTVDEQKRMAQEIGLKAPTATAGLDKESALALREELRAEQEAAKTEQKEKDELRKEKERREELETKEKNETERLEMKEKYQTQRDQINNKFHERMEHLREIAAEERQNRHDLKTFAMLGMKLDAEQKKQFETDKGKINKEVTDSVNTLKQQLTQANQNLRSLKTSASNHWLMGPGKDEITQAQAQVDSIQRAVDYVEKNRSAINAGKADLGEIVGKAIDLSGGGGDDSVPGFKPDTK